MRVLLIVAGVALVAVAGLLVLDRDDRDRSSAREPTSGAAPVPATTTGAGERSSAAPLPRAPAGLDAGPRAQEKLRRFVADCVAGGPEAVPALLARLRGEPDVRLLPRWTFADGAPEGFPTLRSAYLAALAGIPGEEAADALRAVLGETESVEETYQIALALHERRDGGWAEAALGKAGAAVTPLTLPVQKALVALAAREAPVTTAAQVVARAPRGDDATDPAVLALALRDLPLDAATGASAQLLDDAAVTNRAKGRYVEALCNRPDVEPRVWEHLRDVIGSADWPGDLRIKAAYAAAGAQSFFLDEVAYTQARAAGDTRKAEAIKARYTQRLVAVENLVQTAIGSDLADPADPRAASLRRMLDRHRERVR